MDLTLLDSAFVVFISSLSRYLIGKVNTHATVPFLKHRGMAQRAAGNPLAGYSDGSEERIDETSVASQIRAREAAIAREADAENVSPSQPSTSSPNPDTTHTNRSP